MTKLEPIFKNAGIAGLATPLCLEHQELSEISTKFVHFVTPWLAYKGECIAETALRDAFTIFAETRCYQDFVTQLCKVALKLSEIQVSVPDAEGYWNIWFCEQPLSVFAKQFRGNRFKIMKRETPLPVQGVITRLLAEIACTQELMQVVQYGEVVLAVAGNGELVQAGRHGQT